jgi:hypothetical protein
MKKGEYKQQKKQQIVKSEKYQRKSREPSHDEEEVKFR